MRSNKQYLGDSVYAEWDGYHIILMTENGLPTDPSNRIYIEPQVLDALNNYAKTLIKETHHVRERRAEG